MELYGLDCGFSGLMYNFFVLPKKCKFSEEKKKKSPIFHPAASNRYTLTDFLAMSRKTTEVME